VASTLDSQPGRRRPGTPAGLTRADVIAAALAYIDEYGADALSMHKLGAELGVKGMSLYNHVSNKTAVLDGVVELLWSEVEDAAPAGSDWRESLRALARAIRAVVHRHPNAAPLMVSQSIMPTAALRTVEAYRIAATRTGQSEAEAYAVLRTIWTYALGSALSDLSWRSGPGGCTPSVRDLLRPDVPAELAAVADVFCGQHDPDKQFELGLELMLRGLETPEPQGTRQRARARRAPR
jgi:TetR/AcrR family tetracycline transcriptional repressor